MKKEKPIMTNRKKHIKRFRIHGLCCAALVILTTLFCSCSKDELPELPSGAVVIEGIYISDELPVAYYFTKDGFGVQYIAGEAYRIRYYILDGKIHIENYSVENGDSSVFDFEYFDEFIVIGGVKYMLSDGDKTIDISTSV